jgi:signal transduction histidine kinase
MKLFVKICVLALLLSPFVGYSRHAEPIKDSLFIKIQQSKSADEEIKAYTNVLLYYSSRNLDSANYFSKQAVKKFKSTNDKVSEGRIYHTMANIYKDRLSYDTAKSYIDKAFVVFNSITYDKGIAKCYNTNGIIAAQKADYKLAANFFMRGLRIAEKLEDVNGMIQGYANMGSVYGYLKNPRKAIYYFQQAQDLNQKEYGESYYKIFGNMASAYFDLGEYKDALAYYKICIDRYEEIGLEQDDYITFLTEAGDCEFALNNISSALNYYNQAYPMSLEAELPMQQADILFQLAKLYDKNNQFELAIDHVKKAIVLGRKYELLELVVNALELQSSIYAEMKQFPLAYSTIKEHDIYRDSLQRFQQKKDVELLEADYKVEKSTAEIEKLELLNQKNTLMKSIYLILFVSFLIIAITLYTSLNKRNQLNRMLEKSNAVKDRLLSIIAHDLKSPLSNIVSVLDAIDQGAFSKEEQNEIVTALKNQTNVTLETLENLLKWGQAQLRGITVKPENFKIKDQLTKAILFVTAQANSKNIKINLSADQDWNGNFDQEHFNFIVRNYLANAIKFSPAESTIQVHTELDHQMNTLKISIIDKGMGIKAEDVPTIFQESPKVNFGTNNERGSGLGLRLCKEFAEANNGSVGFKTKAGEGSEFYFTCEAA